MCVFIFFIFLIPFFFIALSLSLLVPLYVFFFSLSTFQCASLLFTSFACANVCLCGKMSEWVLVSCCSWVSSSFFSLLIILWCFFRFYSICSVHILLLMCYCSLLFHPPFFLHLFCFQLGEARERERRLCSFLFYMVAFVELAAIKANGNGTGVFVADKKNIGVSIFA